MANQILAEITASLSELKRNPRGSVVAGEGFPVVIPHQIEPAFYRVPVEAYEALKKLETSN